MKYLIGIDLGTSGCKICVVGETMQLVAVTKSKYRTGSAKEVRPGWVDFDADAWVEAVKSGLKTVLAEVPDKRNVKAISFSGQMHGLIALDDAGSVVRPAITCLDGRSDEQCQEIYDSLGGEHKGRLFLLSQTNNYMFPSFTSSKILWMKQHEPELFSKVETVLTPKDYIRYRMTDVKQVDVSDASGYGLFDVQHSCWSSESIIKSGLPVGVFPKVAESTDPAGTLSPEWAAELGLSEDTLVVTGGGDAIVQTSVGCAGFDDRYAITLGTGALVGCTSGTFAKNPTGTIQMFRGNMPGTWTSFGGTGSGGGAYSWMMQRFYQAECAAKGEQFAYDLMETEAGSVPAGCGGLICYPMFVGQRSPFEDSNSRGCFIGARPGHGRGAFLRSLIEGVTFCLKDNSLILEEMTGAPAKISVTGGAANDTWCQVISDVFGLEVIRIKGYRHAGAIGAAILAGCGAGVWSSIREASEIQEIDRIFAPEREASDAYRDAFSVYQDVYPSLKTIFERQLEMYAD